jgi:hypothetical protein
MKAQEPDCHQQRHSGGALRGGTHSLWRRQQQHQPEGQCPTNQPPRLTRNQSSLPGTAAPQMATSGGSMVREYSFVPGAIWKRNLR